MVSSQYAKFPHKLVAAYVMTTLKKYMQIGRTCLRFAGRKEDSTKIPNKKEKETILEVLVTAWHNTWRCRQASWPGVAEQPNKHTEMESLRK